MKILLIEDDSDLREVMRKALEGERYVVETASTYAEAEAKLFVYAYDCVLLDLMLPGGSGLALLREAQARGLRPSVIIISAKDALEDKVAGLDLGADDYLAKPFHLAELHARLKSVLRRRVQGGDTALQVGNLRMLTDTFEAEVAGRRLDLVRKEYDLLHYFAARPRRLVEKTTLAEAVWGDHADQADNFDFIYAQVKNLRRKLREAGASVEIKSVYGFGYKLVEA